MGTLHCFQTFRIERATNQPVDELAVPGEGPSLEGTLRAYQGYLSGNATQDEALRIVGNVCAIACLQALKAQGLEVLATARFKLSAVIAHGKRLVLVRVSQVFNQMQSTVTPYFFLIGARDMYPKQVTKTCKVVKNPENLHLITLPMSPLYRV